MRGFLIAFLGVIDQSSRSAGHLVPGGSQAVIQAFGRQIVQKLTGWPLGSALVANLDKAVVSGSVGSAPVMPSTQTTEKRH